MRKAEAALEEVKDKVEVAKIKIDDTVRAINREQLPTPPVKISNDFKIKEMEKPTAFFLFREDFEPNNKVSFNGTFKSRWAVKFNDGVDIDGTIQNPLFRTFYDIQLNGPVGKSNLQVKVKQDRLTAQLDFGHHLVHNEVSATQSHRNLFTFLNPYVYFECNDKIRDHLYGIGLMTYFNRDYRDHWRLDFKQGSTGLDWQLTHNLLAKHRGFFLNWILGITYNKALAFKNRQFMVGYDRDEVNANLELIAKEGPVNDWKIEKATASASYDFRERGLLGLMAETSFVDRIDTKHVDDFSFAYRNKLRRDLEFKGKLSARGNANFFFNYIVRDGFNIQTSFLTSLVDRKDLKGFLGAPFGLGLKIKYAA